MIWWLVHCVPTFALRQQGLQLQHQTPTTLILGQVSLENELMCNETDLPHFHSLELSYKLSNKVFDSDDFVRGSHPALPYERRHYNNFLLDQEK